ncbi:MAG: hypothetical protein HDS82_03800 [Bacteroidales bacterium]|nr:hypothetical protein [Bacteroidales bacterium]
MGDSTNSENQNEESKMLTGETALITIIICFVVCSILFMIPKCSRIQHTPTDLKVTVECVTDSADLSKIRIVEGAFTDSVVSRINRQEEELNRTYALFMKAREDDADLMKYLSVLGGLLISAFTIIGIRSLKEFMETVKVQISHTCEDIAKKEAKDEASAIAAEEAKKVATAEASVAAKAQAIKTAKKEAKNKAHNVAMSIAKKETERVVQFEVRQQLNKAIGDDDYFKGIAKRVKETVLMELLPKWEGDIEELKRKIDNLSIIINNLSQDEYGEDSPDEQNPNDSSEDDEHDNDIDLEVDV